MDRPRPERAEDLARCFISGDSRGVHAAACTEIVPCEVDAPGLLLEQIEVQRKEKSQQPKPILPDPTTAKAIKEKP